MYIGSYKFKFINTLSLAFKKLANLVINLT